MSNNDEQTTPPIGAPEYLDSHSPERLSDPPEQKVTTVATPEKSGSEIWETLHRGELKIKEYLGALSEKDFRDLLTYDFKTELKDNPPLNKEFDPQKELDSFRTLLKEHKTEDATKFKGEYRQNLAHQREAWAVCRTTVERYIEFNPDVARKNLMEVVNRFGQSYGFTEEQVGLAGTLLDKYYEQHQMVVELRQQFPDALKLVNALTGVGFTEEDRKDIRVSLGPMTFDILTSGINAAKIYKQVPEALVSSPFGGFASESLMGNQLVFWSVINKDILKASFPPHEEQHQRNKLFRRFFERPDLAQSQKYRENIGQVFHDDPEVRAEAIRSVFKVDVAATLEDTKDELLAMKRGNQFVDPIFAIRLNQLLSLNGSYDFLKTNREASWIKDDPLAESLVQEVMVNERNRIIHEAWYKFDDLVKMGKYSVDEAVALLTNEPLDRWPNFVRHQLEAKGVHYNP